MISRERGPRPRLVLIVIAGCTAVGLFLRLYQLTRPGYLTGVTEYDDGVLFGNALRLANGVIPYRDFAVVQPPGSILLMAPVAVLAKVTGSAWGLGIARLLTVFADCAAIALLGVLVRHRGPLAAGVACGIYAVDPDALVAAHTFLLEPWLNMFCLVGAVLAFDGDRLAGGRRLAWAGVVFGFAAAVKLWALVPLAVVAVIVLLPAPGERRSSDPLAVVARRAQPPRLRQITALTCGAVAGLGLPLLPFLILAPGALFRGVLVGQFVRSSNGGQAQLPQRLADMLGLSAFPSFPLTPVLLLIAVALLALTVAGCWAARRPPAALDWYALVGAVAVTVMFMIPRLYYHHYGAFLGPFLALVVALPAGRLALRAEGLGAGRLATTAGRYALTALLAMGAVATVVVGWAGVHDLRTESGLYETSVAGVADRLIPPGACVLTNNAAYTVSASRFISDAPGCPSMVDSFGTLITLTSGHDMQAARPVLSTVTAVWRSGFERASYVWLLTGSQGQIPWTRSLYQYFLVHYRLIGLGSRDGSSSDVPPAGIYVRRAA
jgi:alpha-1,2-mannosyltransferase